MNIEWSMPPRCDMCAADAAECYPPTNDKGYTGLCKDCFHIFYEENTHLFKHPNWVDIDWVLNMANSIASQVLNNEHCKEHYARIFAMATLKVDEALRAVR